jgi:hypothetical protein
MNSLRAKRPLGEELLGLIDGGVAAKGEKEEEGAAGWS